MVLVHAWAVGMAYIDGRLRKSAGSRIFFRALIHLPLAAVPPLRRVIASPLSIPISAPSFFFSSILNRQSAHSYTHGRAL